MRSRPRPLRSRSNTWGPPSRGRSCRTSPTKVGHCHSGSRCSRPSQRRSPIASRCSRSAWPATRRRCPVGTKNNPGQFDCYTNAEPDEPMFVLLGRDPAAPYAIREWIEMRKTLIEAGQKPETDWPMLEEAMVCANEMEEWRRKNRDVLIASEDLRTDPDAAP